MKKGILGIVLILGSSFVLADEYCPPTVVCKNQVCQGEPFQYIFTNIWFNPPIKDGVYLLDSVITVVVRGESTCYYKGDPNKGNPDSLTLSGTISIMPDYKADQNLWIPPENGNAVCYQYGGANGNNKACPFLNPFKKS